jgi:hypothetical protein
MNGMVNARGVEGLQVNSCAGWLAGFWYFGSIKIKLGGADTFVDTLCFWWESGLLF